MVVMLRQPLISLLHNLVYFMGHFFLQVQYVTQNDYVTRTSREVTHPTITLANWRLAALCGWEAAGSGVVATRGTCTDNPCMKLKLKRHGAYYN